MKKLALLVFIFPLFAHAAVRINEVAWMGTPTSSTAEWLELFNTDGAPVNLSGWRIESSTGSPSIKLTGTISAGGYYLLERTRATNIPGLTADQVYTGSLANTGATLTLYDAASSTTDTVVGGTNWADIGGDNTTKNTAQRTDTGWITAAPTPRAANATVGVQPPAPKVSSKKAKVDISSPALSPAHGTQAPLAPAAANDLAAAGAPLPDATPAAQSHSFLASPWVWGLGGLLVISAGALIVL